MPRTENNEEYMNGKEIMDLWPASRNLFYGSIQPRLQTYHFDGKKRPHYYKLSEVLALKSGKPMAQREPITLSGIFGDWTVYLRSLGYQAETQSSTIEIGPLPEEVSSTFHLSSKRQFVRRPRKTLANGVPICMWSTYYPLELVEGKILAEMEQNPGVDVVRRMKDVHNVVVRWEKDRSIARFASLEEQEHLQLLTNEPVLILQRACWTSDRQILTHVSHMILLGSWFAIEHETEVPAETWGS